MAPAMAPSLGKAQLPQRLGAIQLAPSSVCKQVFHAPHSRGSCVRVYANAPAGSVASVVMSATLIREPAVFPSRASTIEVVPSLSPPKILSSAPSVVRPPPVLNPVSEITPELFQELVVEAGDSQLVVVDYFTDWCGPCQLMHKELDKMTGAFRKVKFYKLNCSKGDTNFATHQRIRTLPTFRIYKRGACVDEVTGARPVQLRQLLLHHSVMN